ncbi:adenine phosphoribosyltransferase, partial [Acinetobacter baumannii]|nr:adenine phosphoribosyltransferase [Acinetobacter baumannii]
MGNTVSIRHTLMTATAQQLEYLK